MLTRINSSIVVQMTLLVLGSTALVLALVEGFSYVRTRQMILKTGENVAVHLTRSMTRRVEQEFRAVKKVPETLALYLNIMAPKTEDGVLMLLRQTMAQNPEIYGSGLFCEPNAFMAGQQAFAPYFFRQEDRIEYAQLAGSGFSYNQKHFYVIPKVFSEPVWSAPFLDEEGGSALMVTYAVPVFGKGNPKQPREFEGVVTADISLKWLTELTRSVHMGKKGFSFIITDSGVFVAHPDTSYLLKESIFSRAEKSGRPELRKIARKMIREEQGFMATGLALAGQQAYLAWDKIPSTGWSFGTVVVKNELFYELDLLARYALVIGVVGILLLAGVSIIVARSFARPLIAMAGTTQQIARGDFDVDLSGIRRKDEIGTLALSIEGMAEGLKQKEFIRSTFGRYLTTEVVNKLLESKDGLELGGQARHLTLMMSDLRGFTALTANMPPEKVISFLNRYLGQMVDILVRHRGVIDEIIGDGILAFFGAPEPMEDHTLGAVACALEMQTAMVQINAANRHDGLARLEMGIAVHTGKVVVGNIGSKTRSKYGAVGSEVNFTGRMESYTVGGQILVSQAVKEILAEQLIIKEHLSVQMKGMPEPVDLYDITGLKGGTLLAEKQEYRTPLPTALKVTAQRLNQKSLDEKELAAVITHTSQTSAVLVLSKAVGQWEDLRVMLPHGMGEFYGKVMQVQNRSKGGCDAVVRTTSLSPDAYGLFSPGPGQEMGMDENIGPGEPL